MGHGSRFGPFTPTSPTPALPAPSRPDPANPCADSPPAPGRGGGGCSSSRRSRCPAPSAGHLGAVRWRHAGSEAVAMPGGAFRSAARHAGLRGEQRVSQRHWGTYYPCGILGSEAPAQPLTGAIWPCGYAAVVRWTLLGPLRSADPRCCTSGGSRGLNGAAPPLRPPISGLVVSLDRSSQCPVPRAADM
jgi:hypothetical protein